MKLTGSSSVRRRRSSITTFFSSLEGLFVYIDAPHAVGFHLQPVLQLLLGAGFKVGGIIPGGKGVIRASHLLHFPGEILRTVLGSAFEHHVLSQVGDAGFAQGFISGADPIPELQSDNGGPGLLEEQHREAIGQFVLHHLVKEVAVLRRFEGDSAQPQPGRGHESHQQPYSPPAGNPAGPGRPAPAISDVAEEKS